MLTKNTIHTTSLQHLSFNPFPYQFLPQQLLPDLIRNDLDPILYSSPTNLPTKYPLQTIQEVIHFFQNPPSPTLTILEHKPPEIQFQLKRTLIP
ncbi:DUF2507 domain-containing protein, partial [Bacillus cereus]|uniref:DUF2507 domain-containing protein n=1 Tax=Bacillus cereus TaxID=1396 RepID=UPI0011A21644